MKKIAILLILISGIVLLDACKKAETDPKLDMSLATNPVITSPADGSSYVLTEETADDMISFTWSAATYNLSDLASTTYLLQMISADSSFDNGLELISTTDLAYSTSVSNLNNTLLNMGYEGGTEAMIDFRVTSSLKSYDDGKVIEGTTRSSEVITSTFTPYEDDIYVKPIYLIGSGTSIGWDNAAALPMAWLGDARFGRVETLTGGTDQAYKWISVLTQWAPQWGTDDAGTLEGGNMIYRPTEADPDPLAIMVGDESFTGDYYIEADTANLTYKAYLTSGELYLVGDASSAGWENTTDLKFTEGPDHVFTLTTDLNAEGGMKFLEVSGAWAPQWGTTESGSAITGMLVYRPTESDPDPANIPAPGSAGTYTITVDMTTMMYTVEAK